MLTQEVLSFHNGKKMTSDADVYFTKTAVGKIVETETHGSPHFQYSTCNKDSKGSNPEQLNREIACDSLGKSHSSTKKKT